MATNKDQDDRRGFMDYFATCWEALGRYFGHRPLQMIGLFVGAAVVIVALAFSSISTVHNSGRINKVQAAFCNGDAKFNSTQKMNCRKLLDQLLKNPTPEQARRLREIVKEQ